MRENSTARVRKADALALLAAVALAGCPAAGPRPTPPEPAAGAAPAAGPRESLERFLAAARSRDCDAMWRMLSGRLRQRYTPARLCADYDAVRSSADEKLARAEAARESEPRLKGDAAEFEISPGRAVRLVREAGEWRLDALE